LSFCDANTFVGVFAVGGSNRECRGPSGSSSGFGNPSNRGVFLSANSFIGTVLISDDDDRGLSEDVLPQMPASDILSDAVKEWYSPAYIEIVEVS
jgi:hypothetical protein